MWFLLVLLYASSPHLSSTQEYRLILQDGDGPCEGYVKIFHNNKWGVVGDQKWHENNEKVICKSIGCGTSVRSKDIVLQKVWDITWMNEVECDGNEEYLWNCMFPGWNSSSYTKDTLKLITCSDKIHLELESLPGYRCAGTLKYKKTSMEKVIETGYFIHPNWDKQQADLVCEHLKCGQSKGLPAAGTFSRKETLTNLKPIKCSSVEHQKHIWQCITKDDVGNGEPVAVICSDHHNFRLQGGDNVCSGELEVDDGGGLWKPVCQSQYKLNASNHDLCSHMRCGTNHVQERMVCDGSKNISLDCTDKVNTLLLDDQSQSVSHCFGSVHFNHSGRLEAVCFNDWDTKDGEVVCRELNCGEVVSVRSGSQTKDGMHDRVDCKGSEASLWHCLANHYENSTTCSKVKVICSGSVNVRLSDGPGKCAGRVEIQYDGVWKSVSASNWKVENSKVMCNELRCGDALDAPDSFIQGTRPVMNIEVTCANDSKSISYCIKPKKTLKQQQKKNKMLICQEHKVVFLVGGSACSGKVGIERAGKSYWLSASNDTWDHETATVVCQQMDCGNAISISFESTSTVLASGTTELWKYSYNCRSKEKSIFDCKRSKRLSNHSIASVVCSGNKTVSLNGQGEGKCWGKVNVCLNGMCGGVCEDAWTKNKSDMLCKALSCGSAIDPLSYPPSAEDKITISSVHSTQQTTNINQCNMVKNVDGSSCQKNPAIVVCSESVEAKLIDHRERCSGNVKMFYQGNWHPVCKTALQNQDVQNTICRELGCGQAVKALSLFGPSPESSVAVVSNLTCNATSKSSSECRVNLTQTNQCPLGGLQCSEWRRMVLKLGKGACEGQVFVYSEGDSRAVSGDGWTKTEAKVLCADLGCGAYKNHSVGNADYNGLWWGKTYSCEGKTKSIWDCEKNDRPSQNQSLNVQCQDNFRASLVNLGDPGKCFGQVTLNNLPVCYDNWDDSHNKIACQEQECSNSVSFEETNKGSQNEGHFVSCVGSESNLGQCKTTRGKCSRGLVSVSCADRVKFNTTQKCGGNIEILYRDTWELVCKPDINTENILCKELGCHYFSELNRGQFEITEEEKRERRRPEVSLRCPPDIKKLQHCLVKNGCDKPGKITCKGYSLKEPIVPTPINLYVGLSLGALSLVMVAALCLFLRRRFVTRFKSRFSMRKESTFESGDYEDVETNGHELLGPTEMRDLNHHESESGGDKENGRRSATSSLSYDDIAEEENVPAQPLSSGGDGTSSPEHVTYEVEEDQQESYDDVVSMIPPAETREEIAEVHERPKPKGLEIHDG